MTDATVPLPAPRVGSVSLLGAFCILVSGCATFEDHFPAGVRPSDTSIAVDSLKRSLRDAEMDAALRRYFGEVYVDDVVDLVVYIPAAPDSAIQSRLVWKGKERKALSGKRYVWVLAFTEERERIEARLTSLDYQEDRVLHAALSMITTFLGRAVSPVDRPSVAQDSTYGLPLSSLHSPGDSSRLYAGMSRIPIADNTMNRVSIRRTSGDPLPQGQSFHFNFPNGERSLFGLSIAGGVTFDSGSERLRADSTIARAGESFDPLLVLHWDLCRSVGWEWCASYPPWSAGFTGLAAGSNLGDGGLFDSSVVGLMLGRVFNDMGLLLGANRLKETRYTIREGRPRKADPERKWRFLMAVTYAF